MGRAKKGSSFEREICVTLSKWWTEGMRDDVFWRTSQSGGRAKLRGRKGKDTHGQHGDIIAVDPIGEPLIDLFTIELKRGYATATPYDVIDRYISASMQKWEKWIAQVYESHEQAGSFAWWLITRRDFRESILFMPLDVFLQLTPPKWDGRYMMFWTEVRTKTWTRPFSIMGVLLGDFLTDGSPDAVREMSKRC